MKDYIVERVLQVARFILENKATVRCCAKHFAVSKSTVHKDVTDRLESLDSALRLEVKEVLDTNLNERHLRGGFATREKYAAEANGEG